MTCFRQTALFPLNELAGNGQDPITPKPNVHQCVCSNFPFLKGHYRTRQNKWIAWFYHCPSSNRFQPAACPVTLLKFVRIAFWNQPRRKQHKTLWSALNQAVYLRFLYCVFFYHTYSIIPAANIKHFLLIIQKQCFFRAYNKKPEQCSPRCSPRWSQQCSSQRS